MTAKQSKNGQVSNTTAMVERLDRMVRSTFKDSQFSKKGDACRSSNRCCPGPTGKCPVVLLNKQLNTAKKTENFLRLELCRMQEENALLKISLQHTEKTLQNFRENVRKNGFDTDNDLLGHTLKNRFTEVKSTQSGFMDLPELGSLEALTNDTLELLENLPEDGGMATLDSLSLS